MKKKFIAIMKFLQGVDPKGSKPRQTSKEAKRKGFYVQNPTPFDLSVLTALVADWKPHLIVEHNPTPVQNKTSGKWYDPSVFVGQPFAEATDDELYDYGQDL